MLSSITPFGERGRRQRFTLTATAFVAGALAGGVAIGVLAGTVGSLLPSHSASVDVAVVAALALVGAAFDAHIGGLRVPTIRRQVDENWLTAYRGWVYGLGFGAQLGFGVATIVTTAAVYVMVAIAVVSGSVVGGIVIGATFGLVRGLSVLGARRLRTADDLRAFHRRLADRASIAARAGVAGQGAIACAALATLVVTR